MNASLTISDRLLEQFNNYYKSYFVLYFPVHFYCGHKIKRIGPLTLKNEVKESEMFLFRHARRAALYQYCYLSSKVCNLPPL